MDGLCIKHCSIIWGPLVMEKEKLQPWQYFCSSRAWLRRLTTPEVEKIKQGRGGRKGGHQRKQADREFLMSKSSMKNRPQRWVGALQTEEIQDASKEEEGRSEQNWSGRKGLCRIL